MISSKTLDNGRCFVYGELTVDANLSEDEAGVKRVADQALLDGGDGGWTTAKMSWKQTVIPSHLTQNSELVPVQLKYRRLIIFTLFDFIFS